jgi:hypothetical protein
MRIVLPIFSIALLQQKIHEMKFVLLLRGSYAIFEKLEVSESEVVIP